MAHFVSQPISSAAKLQAVSQIKGSNISPSSTVPPAQITLTASTPCVGAQNFLGFQGSYTAANGSPAIFLSAQVSTMSFHFATTRGKTYLLDVSISVAQNWTYEVVQVGAFDNSTPITAQQGHLLIPFIATATTATVVITPTSGGQEDILFGRAELTRMD